MWLFQNRAVANGREYQIFTSEGSREIQWQVSCQPARLFGQETNSPITFNRFKEIKRTETM